MMKNNYLIDIEKKDYNTPTLKQIGKVGSMTKTNDTGRPNDGGAPGPHRIS